MASLWLTIPAFNKPQLQAEEVGRVLHRITKIVRTGGLKFAASEEYSRFF
jgi:hypothetical protein